MCSISLVSQFMDAIAPSLTRSLKYKCFKSEFLHFLFIFFRMAMIRTILPLSTFGKYFTSLRRKISANFFYSWRVLIEFLCSGLWAQRNWRYRKPETQITFRLHTLASTYWICQNMPQKKNLNLSYYRLSKELKALDLYETLKYIFGLND